MRRIIARCAQCEDTGAVTAIHTETGTLYGFSCSCEVAKRKARLYPIWDREKFPEYELVSDPTARRKAGC